MKRVVVFHPVIFSEFRLAFTKAKHKPRQSVRWAGVALLVGIPAICLTLLLLRLRGYL